MSGCDNKTIEGVGGLILKTWPLEKGSHHDWTVRVTRLENCDPKDALLSVCVVTERENDLHFPARGASKEGWGIVFWEKWKQSIFSHDNKRVESFKVHRVGEGDVVDVSLSEVGVLSFVLNGEERKNFPFPLPWGEALYPAVFAMVQGGEMGVEIEVDAPFNLKPPKT